MIKLICKQCSKEYKSYLSRQKKSKFCSLKCWLDYHSTEYVECECKQCKKHFQISKKRFEYGRGVFCSKDCYSKNMMKGSNKKTRREINKEYRAKNRDKCGLWKHRRRALKAKVGGSYTEKEWLDVKEMYNNRCANCKKKIKLTVDHIIPLTKWIEWEKVNKPNYSWNDIENIQPLCTSCNSSKSDSLKI